MNSQIDKGNTHFAWSALANIFQDIEFKLLSQVIPIPISAKLESDIINLFLHELLNGSGELSDWVKKAKYLGQNAIGICDRNTMAATLNLQKECTKAGLKYVFGYSFTLEHEGNKVDMKIYCQSQKGLRNFSSSSRKPVCQRPIHFLLHG